MGVSNRHGKTKLNQATLESGQCNQLTTATVKLSVKKKKKSKKVKLKSLIWQANDDVDSTADT